MGLEQTMPTLYPRYWHTLFTMQRIPRRSSVCLREPRACSRVEFDLRESASTGRSPLDLIVSFFAAVLLSRASVSYLMSRGIRRDLPSRLRYCANVTLWNPEDLPKCFASAEVLDRRVYRVIGCAIFFPSFSSVPPSRKGLPNKIIFTTIITINSNYYNFIKNRWYNPSIILHNLHHVTFTQISLVDARFLSLQFDNDLFKNKSQTNRTPSMH